MNGLSGIGGGDQADIFSSINLLQSEIVPFLRLIFVVVQLLAFSRQLRRFRCVHIFLKHVIRE